MVSALWTERSASLNNTVDLAAFATDFGGGDLVLAARRFDIVRYTVVACLTIAFMDRILMFTKELSTKKELPAERELPGIWSPPMTVPKFFYFLNRYPNLCCVGLDVFVFTQRVSVRSDCVWWFTFRTWAAIFVSTVLEALLVFKLWILFGKCKYTLVGFSGLSIAQTLGTSFLVKSRIRCVKNAPYPGEWFSGCFPLFHRPHDVAHEWLSLAAVIATMTFTAIIWLICTWRKRPGSSLWKLAKQYSIFHIIGLCVTSAFCAAFFLTAPQPLSSIVPSVSSTMFSVFGCRIALEMPDYAQRDPFLNPLPADYELEEDVNQGTMRKKSDLESGSIHSANRSSRGDTFSEVSNLDCIKPAVGGSSSPAAKSGLEISPLSQAATLVPVPTAEIRGLGVQPAGEFCGSEVTLSSTEAAQQQVAITTTKTLAESRRSTLVGSTFKPSNVGSSSQIGTILDSRTIPPMELETIGAMSSPAAKAGPSNPTLEEEDDDFDELDRELAEKYDEEGRIRPPRRTHERQWRSDDYLGLPYMLSGHGFLMPRASSSLAGRRPASAIYYSNRPTFPPPSPSSTARTLSQLPPDSTPSGSAPPSRRRSKDWATSPRVRMSRLFSRHRDDVAVVPRSFSPTTSAAEHPTPQTPSRRHSTSSSKSRPGSRMRKLLLAGSSSPTSQTSAPHHPPSSPSSRSPISSARRDSGRRRDSDAMSICSASTGFVFDNSGTYEAPDFN